MNNALRHTALTLAAASALLVLVALPSEPAPAMGVALPGALVTSASVLPTTVPADQVAPDEGLDAPKRVIRKSARHRRQTLVMPFFSFAQRG